MSADFSELIVEYPWTKELIRQSYMAGYAQAHVDLANRLKVIADMAKKLSSTRAEEFFQSLLKSEPPGKEND